MRILMSLFPFFTGPLMSPEGGGGGGGAPAPTPNPTPNPSPAASPQSTPQPAPSQQPAPGGQVFSAEYVEALRNESASYRTQLRAAQAAARAALGLADDAQLPQDLTTALTGLKTAGQQAVEADLNTAKTLYAQGLFAAAGAGKVVDTDAAFALVVQAGYTVEVDLKTKALTVKGADGKALADKDGKALTGKDAMAALVDKLIEKYPFLKGQGAGPSQVGGTAPAGGNADQNDPKAVAKAIAEERAKARGSTGGSSFWGRGKTQA